MIPTVEYIRQKFDEYNELMFEGKLKPLPFKLCSARSFLGQVRCCRQKNADGTWLYSDFQFIIRIRVTMQKMWLRIPLFTR